MFWDDDFVCVRVVYVVFGVEICCVLGGWEENQGEEDVDCWLWVDVGGVEEIIWCIV